MAESVQDRYAPHNACFGCGPANTKGLRLKSVPATAEERAAQEAEGLPTTGMMVCTWRAEPHHEAFPGMLAGGIVGTLLDCHSNWTAAVHLLEKQGGDTPPCTVTAEYHVKMRRPTPTDGDIRLVSWVTESEGDRAVVEARLEAGGKACASCRGVFVAVKEGHPAYHRW